MKVVKNLPIIDTGSLPVSYEDRLDCAQRIVASPTVKLTEVLEPFSSNHKAVIRRRTHISAVAEALGHLSEALTTV